MVLEWDPVEVVLLISGLPASSRYAARLSGERQTSGWDLRDWLALDTRNALEGLRATVVAMASGKKKNQFREWTSYPGQEAQETVKKQASVESKVSWLQSIATPITE